MSSSTVDKKYTLPNGKTVTVDELVSLFKTVQSVPLPTSAIIESIDQQAKACRLQWSFRNLERIDSVKYSTNCFLNYDDSNRLTSISELPGLIEHNTELSSVTSESGQYRICISKSIEKESKNGKSSGQRLDIWSLERNTILYSIDVDSMKHGKIILNSRVASLAFSPNEKQLIYVAEKKVKAESFFKSELFKDEKAKNDDAKKDDTKKDEETSKGTEYEYRSDWGEQFDGLTHTCVCILTFEPELKLKVIELPNLTLAQPFWIDDQTISFIAYQESPKRLGLIYCYNRVGYLYKGKLAQNDQDKDDFKVIRGENDELHIVDAQINPQKNRVLFFENPSAGPHMMALRAVLWDLKNDQFSTLFSDYEAAQPLVKSLFSAGMTSNYWSLDGEHVVFSVANHSKELLIVLNVINKTLKVVDFGLEDCTILNFKNNLLVLAASSPNQPTVVKIGLFNSKANNFFDFKQLNTKHTSKDENISYRIIKQNEDNELNQIETILIGSTENFDKPTPAIIIPHGGPHSMLSAFYNRTVCFYVKLGFKVAMVNYRGSTGFSNQYNNQLCSNVGDYDVKDVMSSVNNLINMNLIDKSNVHLYGASHGGFLVCHLIGQYPNAFKSCIASNPVIDMSKMFGVTDIPEWCLVEALGIDTDVYKELNNWPEENRLVKQLDRLINVGKPDILQVMFDKSPMKYVDNVKTPCLLMLGKVDLRVPHSQGLNFMNALKVRGIETKCFMYEDNHNIGKPAHDSDFLINNVLWFLDHLKV